MTVVETVEVVTPATSNPSGTAHGGHLLQLMDKVGSLAGVRRSRGRCTTASIAEVTFHAPARVGDLLTVRAEVVATGRTSMQVRVVISAEPMDDVGNAAEVLTGRLSLVAVDDDGRPRSLPA